MPCYGSCVSAAVEPIWRRHVRFRSPVQQFGILEPHRIREQQRLSLSHTPQHASREHRDGSHIPDASNSFFELPSVYFVSSYAFRSARVANLALMIRIRPLRSVYDTTSNFPRCDMPRSTKRFSETDRSGSAMVIESGSRNTVLASSKETLCFLELSLAFDGSHSNSSAIEDSISRRILLS